jgi:hypothetical protein
MYRTQVFIIGAALYRIFWFLNFRLISTGQSYAVSVSVCSGVAFQPAHFILRLKDLTAAAKFFGVKRKFNVYHSLTRRMKPSQFVCLLLTLQCSGWKIKSLND